MSLSVAALWIALGLALAAWAVSLVAVHLARSAAKRLCRQLIQVRVDLARERWTAANACRQSGPPPCEAMPAGHCSESTQRMPPRTEKKNQ